MPEATSTHSTFRRRALGSAIIATTTCGIAGTAVAADDRALIADCRRFQRDLDSYLVYCKEHDTRWPVNGPEQAALNARLNSAPRQASHLRGRM